MRVAAGRLPVVAGCGTNDTRTTIAGAERAAKAGADALLFRFVLSKPELRGGFIGLLFGDALSSTLLLVGVPALAVAVLV